MGKVLSLIHHDKIDAKPIFSKRISIEESETYHLHYRNLRLEFGQKNFETFCKVVGEAYRNHKKGLGEKVPGQTFLALSSALDETDSISADELKIEYCQNLYKNEKHSIFGRFADFYVDDIYVHIHFREIRLEMKMATFESFSKGIIRAYVQRSQTMVGNKIPSLKALFGMLNDRGVNYIVMRNWDEILKNKLPSDHPDIDILIDSKHVQLFDVLANSVYTHLETYRVQRQVMAPRPIMIDLRTPYDNYYPENLAERMLKRRHLTGFVYTPHQKDHFYSLLYHAHFHKPELRADYSKYLRKLAQEIKVTIDVTDREQVRTFLLKNNIDIVEPHDLSVQFNP